MKKIRAVLFLLILTGLFMISHPWVQAEGRSIYVGDLIELRVASSNLSMDELQEKFKDFEIVDIKEDTEGYLLTLRSFETGEKSVRLGDKELIIEITSTLEEIERNEIFEGGLSLIEAGSSISWQYALFVFPLLFLSACGIILRKHLKRRKESLISPFQRFISQTNTISSDGKDFFVLLTLYFKEYLEAKFSCRIRGKTSSEIMSEISRLPELQDYLPDIGSWLEECDRLKFAGIIVSKEKKQNSLGELVELAIKIEEI